MYYNENPDALKRDATALGSSDQADVLTELQAIRSDPVFARSSVSARLLQYLVDESVAGRGASLKSYTVAVEALGKGADYEPQLDASARVAVGRLRKALETFYSGPGRQRLRRLLIAPGSYEVTLVENGIGPESGTPAEKPTALRGLKTKRTLLVFCSIAIVLAALAGAVIWRATDANGSQELLRWGTNDFPTVAVRRSGPMEQFSNGFDAGRMVKLVAAATSKFPSARAVTGEAESSDYILDIYPNAAEGDVKLSVSLIKGGDNTIVWSESYIISKSGSVEEISHDIANRISSYSGILNQDILKSLHSYDTPYSCWLRFTYKIRSTFVTSDKILGDCASDWYSANPNHPLAAAVHGWTLVDQSVTEPFESGRNQKLARAVAVLEEAERTFPNSGTAALSLMRAYGFSGQFGRMRAIYPRILAMNSNNFDLQGAIGTMLALQNDPEGERLIDRALANNPNSPALYHFGKFIAAMMRDDVEGAIREVRAAELSDRSMSLLPIMHAATNAKVGRLDAAEAAWAKAGTTLPVLRVNPDLFFDRMPISDDVAARLKEWLAPVLKK